MKRKKKNKNIIIGICGGIAAYKTIDIISCLVKKNINVQCVLTQSAKHFVTELTLKTISKQKIIADMFEHNNHVDIEHISLAEKADLILIAPATANIIAKLAIGLADDFLSTMVLASKSKVIIVPSMNENMYLHPATQEHLKTLKKRHVQVIEPAKGKLACGAEGIGIFPETQKIITTILKNL